LEPRKHSTPNGGQIAFDARTRNSPGAQTIDANTRNSKAPKNAATIKRTADPNPSTVERRISFLGRGIVAA